MSRNYSFYPYPEPRDKNPHYINDPSFIDKSLLSSGSISQGIEGSQMDDNIRVYVALDLSQDAIVRRLRTIIDNYVEANEDNESSFDTDVRMLIDQIDIYDRIWYVRHMPESGEHSREGIELVERFVAELEEIPDGCAEVFPYDVIDELRAEYL